MNSTLLATLDALIAEIAPMEREISVNIGQVANVTQALHWLEINQRYAQILQDIGAAIQSELLRYLTLQAADNMKWFIGVLFTVIVSVLGSPALLFWYAFKSDRLMRKISQANRNTKNKVRRCKYKKKSIKAFPNRWVTKAVLKGSCRFIEFSFIIPKDDKKCLAEIDHLLSIHVTFDVKIIYKYSSDDIMVR